MSYLALAKQFESRNKQYRRGLNLYWEAQAGEAEDAYQTLICLLDELGVGQATLIRQDELDRWLTAS
jgi:hypothetical protein